jgi:2,4-dienoyl-CoA reductase-like NADH-dependent reductase (Old Yellow Enzyme family)
MRFPLEVAARVRAAVPEQLPVFTRISATDWTDGGWDLESSVELSRRLKAIGIDLIDVSSGGNVPYAKIEIGPGYQVPFSREIREKADVPTSAVGMITEAEQAEKIVASGEADAVMIARESLRDPYFPIHAAGRLGGHVDVPRQYGRAIDLKRAKTV